MFTETLGQALTAIRDDLKDRQVVISDANDDWLNTFSFGGLAYGTDRSAHVEIETIKGKRTKKFAHATIWRSYTGRYEWNVYVL